MIEATVCEPRFQIRGDFDVKVVLKSRESESDTAIVGRLMDLSKHGAKLTVGPNVAADRSYQMEFSITQLRLRITLDASICWTEPLGESHWMIGCSFVPGIPDKIFGKLTKAGEVERGSLPQHVLKNTQLPAIFESSIDPFMIPLHNYSRGGFSIVSHAQAKVGDQLHVMLDDYLVIANVLWQLDHDSEFLTGCSFANPQDYYRLQDFLNAEQTV